MQCKSSFFDCKKLSKFSKFGLLKHQEEKKEYLKIYIKINNSLAMDKEAYSLEIDQDGIRLISSDYKGLFYGVQTLLQLLETYAINDCPTMQGLEIEDNPRFKWRGLMLDVGRHMMPLDFIKRAIVKNTGDDGRGSKENFIKLTPEPFTILALLGLIILFSINSFLSSGF